MRSPFLPHRPHCRRWRKCRRCASALVNVAPQPTHTSPSTGNQQIYVRAVLVQRKNRIRTGDGGAREAAALVIWKVRMQVAVEVRAAPDASGAAGDGAHEVLVLLRRGARLPAPPPRHLSPLILEPVLRLADPPLRSEEGGTFLTRCREDELVGGDTLRRNCPHVNGRGGRLCGARFAFGSGGRLAGPFGMPDRTNGRDGVRNAGRRWG